MTRDQARQAQERVVRRLLASGWEIDEHLPALGVVCMTRATITSDGTLGKQHKTIGPRGQTTDMLDKGATSPGKEGEFAQASIIALDIIQLTGHHLPPISPFFSGGGRGAGFTHPLCSSRQATMAFALAGWVHFKVKIQRFRFRTGNRLVAPVRQRAICRPRSPARAPAAATQASSTPSADPLWRP